MTTGKRRDAPQTGHDAPIPKKLYFKIGEVTQLVGVQAHVLRYWEKEIPVIRPCKSVSNQRRYRHKDVELFREIRRLLYEQRYTLAGARRRLLGGPDEDEATEQSHEGCEESAAREAFSVGTVDGEGVVSAGGTTTQVAPSGAVVQQRDATPVPSGPGPEVLERLREGLRELVRLSSEKPGSSQP